MSQHPAKAEEVLQADGPINGNEVDTWISGLKLTTDKKKALQQTLVHYESLTSRSHAPTLAQAKEILVKYGIPTSKAMQYKFRPAVKTLITATFLLE